MTRPRKATRSCYRNLGIPSSIPIHPFLKLVSVNTLHALIGRLTEGGSQLDSLIFCLSPVSNMRPSHWGFVAGMAGAGYVLGYWKGEEALDGIVRTCDTPRD